LPHRAAADAFRVGAAVDKFKADGVEQGGQPLPRTGRSTRRDDAGADAARVGDGTQAVCVGSAVSNDTEIEVGVGVGVSA